MDNSHLQQSTMNGGGFIAGLLQHPQRPDTLFARSDVAGVFKSEDGGRSWRAVNQGMTAYHQHDVRSFAISPHDPDLLFRCSGSKRGDDFFGFIHRSTDGGETWHLVCTDVDFYGNGEGRQYGDVIQVDPFNARQVVAGGYSKGLWISSDGGETWHCAGLRDERISCVCFHPSVPNQLFVGTIGSYDADPLFVEQQYDYLRPHPARLVVSSDSGATWTVMVEGHDFAEIAFDPTAPELLHAACLMDGILRSTDGGHTWTCHAPGLSKYKIGTVTVDRMQPDTVYAAAETFPNHDPEVPPIGVYRSTDRGESWQLVRWHTQADIHNYPSYMSLPYAGWATSKIRVDVRDSHTLFMSNWYGVAVSHNGGLTWDAHHFRGMENICIENIVTHPTQAGTVFMVMADHSPKRSTDGGRTYQSIQRAVVEKTQPDSTALVASRFRPDFALYGIKGSGGCSIIRSALDGSSAQVVFECFAAPDTAASRLEFQSRAAGVSVQALAEDSFQPGTFFAYLDGILERGAGIYRSNDWGEQWQRLANPFPAHIQRVPHERFWIENELLSVVIAQTKNVCGTNQLMCVDSHQPDTLIVGEWTEGLFRTTDGGSTWQDISAGLPFKRDRASVLNVVRADPQQAGVLYAGFIREGLWRSTDDGQHWTRIFPLEDRVFNATSVAVGGEDGRLIVIGCEPLYWSPCLSSLMVSRDGGRTWRDYYDRRLGAVRWKTVALEPDQNTIYAGSCGNSAFYISLDSSSEALPS